MQGRAKIWTLYSLCVPLGALHWTTTVQPVPPAPPKISASATRDTTVAIRKAIRSRHAATYRGYILAGRTVSPENAANIRLVADADFSANNDAVIAALTAATEWSMYAGVSIAVDNTGPEIHLHWSDAPETETEDCALASSLTACTALPHDGLPARDIWLRTAGPNDSCGWTPSYLIRTLGHEMGHALGFSHPNGENSSHVEGTAECTASVCAFAQNYATIMGAFAFPSSDACVPDAPYLACDDILTEQMIYPPANGLPSECQ